MSSPNTPFIPQDLLTYLDKIYPVPKTQSKDVMSEVFFKAGQRQVVDFLISKHAELKEVHLATKD